MNDREYQLFIDDLLNLFEDKKFTEQQRKEIEVWITNREARVEYE